MPLAVSDVVLAVDFFHRHRFFRHRLVFSQTDHGPGLVLDIEILAVAVLGGFHRMTRISRRVHEGARADDAPVLADDGIDLSAQREDQQFIRVIMQV